MARNQGRHRIARRTKIATALFGLSIAVGGIVVSTTTGDPDRASADEVDKSQFVDITKVQPNVDLGRVHPLRVLVELGTAGPTGCLLDGGVLEQDLLDPVPHCVGFDE